MRSLLPKLIHYNQSGYIPGRNITENRRSVPDILNYTRAEKLPGILLFIDFELKNEFNLDDKQVSEAFLLPVKVANEPYLSTFSTKC